MTRLGRRDFIAGVAAAAGGAALGGCGGTSDRDEAAPDEAFGLRRARVARCRRTRAVTDTDLVNAPLVKRMVDKAVMRLARADSIEDGWCAFFGPTDVVAVKVNARFGPGACTHPEVTDAVIAGLLAAGVLPDNITIYDRGGTNLEKSGYPLNSGPGVRVLAADYSSPPTVSGSINGRLATVLTDPRTTALVNVPVLKYHGMVGITQALKNHYGSIHNPSDHHTNRCDPALAELNLLPAIHAKTRLVVSDALRPIGAGGQNVHPQYTWSYGAIMVAKDPLALDLVGKAIVDEWRAAQGMPSVEPMAHYLDTARDIGVGCGYLSGIRLIDI